MTTLIRKIFGGDGDWRETVRAELQFDSTLNDALRNMWEKNQQIALEEKFDLHPVQFAKMCADENFSQYFEADDSDSDVSDVDDPDSDKAGHDIEGSSE